ncbi:MAG: glycosyltransferase family 2 protein [Flavobacterium sp.]
MKELFPKKDSPFFSIIIPVYNVGRYIEDCVGSIQNQSFQNFEVILVNDGSTDDSGEKCDGYSSIFTNVKVIHQLNSGTASARNAGMKLARGAYLWFIDGDDLIPEGAFSHLFDLLKVKDKISVLNFTKRDFKDDEVQDMSIHFPQRITELVTNTGNSIKSMPSSVCFSLYDRNFLNDIGLNFDEDNQFEDEFFNLKLYANHDFTVLNSNLPLYLYRRRNQENKTSLKNGKVLYEKCISKMELFRYVSVLNENRPANEFIRYKKRVYAEYALLFFELYLKQSESPELRNKLIKKIKENILDIPIQGSYFKASQVKRLLYNLNPDLFVAYIRLWTLLQQKHKTGN